MSFSDSNNRHTSAINIPYLYNQMPMDINSSPLEAFFKNQVLDSNNNTQNQTATAEVSPPSSITSETSMLSNKSLPISIPSSHHRNDRKQRRKEKCASTFPNSSKQPLYCPPPEMQHQSRQRRKSAFTVGSLVDKPPVPWPASLTSPPTRHGQGHLHHIKSNHWSPSSNMSDKKKLPLVKMNNLFALNDGSSDEEDSESFVFL